MEPCMNIYVGWKVLYAFYGNRPSIRGLTFYFGYATDNNIPGEAMQLLCAHIEL